MEKLLTLLDPSSVLTTHTDTAPYLTDWRGHYTGRACCIIQPSSTEEVSAIVTLCAEHRVPMVPQGGNTSLCGGATPDNTGQAVLINLSRLNRIREIDTANNTFTVEAGCILQKAQEAAETVNRLFPLSLASEGSCQIGGNLSTNAGGINVLRYGNMRDLVLGLEVVLPDGQIWHGLRGLRKDNTGYNLKHLFIGAEGTLGIITATVLKLFPRPKAVATAWAGLASPAQAIMLLERLRSSCGERITGFEIISNPALALVLKHIAGSHAPLSESHPWHVLIELTDTLECSTGKFDLSSLLETLLEEALKAEEIQDVVIAQTISQTKALWQLRENIAEAERQEGVRIKHDLSIPISHIAEFVIRAESLILEALPGTRFIIFGHIGDGNLHYNLCPPGQNLDTDLPAQIQIVHEIIYGLVARLNGSLSAEHGIGQTRRAALLQYKSAVEIALMRSIKRSLDPLNLMNPGKVL